MTQDLPGPLQRLINEKHFRTYWDMARLFGFPVIPDIQDWSDIQERNAWLEYSLDYGPKHRERCDKIERLVGKLTSDIPSEYDDLLTLVSEINGLPRLNVSLWELRGHAYRLIIQMMFESFDQDYFQYYQYAEDESELHNQGQ